MKEKQKQSNTELTVKQERFAQLVSSGSTYASAYVEAYDVKSASMNNIYVKSSQLMDQDKIRIRVSEIQSETTIRNQVTLDEVLTEMSNWLKFDPIDLFNRDNSLKNLDELPEHVRKSIASFEVVALFETKQKAKVKVGELKKVKLIDKRATADMFLKKMGAYLTKHQVDVEDLSYLRDLLDQIK